jgi:hypothetical protein
MFNLTDWLYVYKKAGKLFLARGKNLGMGIALSWGILLAYLLITPLLFAGGSMFSGLLFSLWQAVLLSVLYYLVLSVIRNQRVGFHTFKDGMMAFFYKVLGVRFLLWILYAFAGNAFLYRFSVAGVAVIPLVMYLVLSPLPETIYLRNENFTGVFGRILHFQKENILIWTAMMAIWQIIFYGIAGTLDLDLLTIAPFASTIRGLSNILILGLGQALFFLWMVYRGLVYQILDKSSRRKREFERRMIV